MQFLIFAGNDIDTTASSGMFELTSSVITNCISFGIIDDNIIERTEVFTITLMQGNFEVELVNNTATIVINDSAYAKNKISDASGPVPSIRKPSRVTHLVIYFYYQLLHSGMCHVLVQ